MFHCFVTYPLLIVKSLSTRYDPWFTLCLPLTYSVKPWLPPLLAKRKGWMSQWLRFLQPTSVRSDFVLCCDQHWHSSYFDSSQVFLPFFQEMLLPVWCQNWNAFFLMVQCSAWVFTLINPLPTTSNPTPHLPKGLIWLSKVSFIYILHMYVNIYSYSIIC